VYRADGNPRPLRGLREEGRTGGGAGTTPSSLFDSVWPNSKRRWERTITSGPCGLRSTFETFWEKSPLLLNNVKFVMSESASYGIYSPRTTDEFAPDEAIYIYLETRRPDPEEERTESIRFRLHGRFHSGG